MILIEYITRNGLVIFYNHEQKMVAKECSICNDIKELSPKNFIVAKRNPTGFVSSCKTCTKLSKNRGRRYTVNLDNQGRLISRDCTSCKEHKSYEHFYTCIKGGTAGYLVVCKGCSKKVAKQYNSIPEVKIKNSIKSKEYRNSNYEKCRAREIKYELENPDKVKIAKSRYAKTLNKSEEYWEIKKTESADNRIKSAREWKRVNYVYIRDYNKEYKRKNIDKVTASATERSSRKRVQEEFSQHFKKETQEWFLKVRKLNNKFGRGSFAVDHIIPLNHPDVCGLHYPENFQILSKSDNSRKHNKFDGTYTNESWRLLYE